MPNRLQFTIFPPMTETALPRITITLAVNGERHEIAGGTSLGDLLDALALDPRMVVVEHNRTILRDREVFGQLTLREGDALEIVHFVGGG
jgi:thiamine biosynthesis protein ThiS